MTNDVSKSPVAMLDKEDDLGSNHVPEEAGGRREEAGTDSVRDRIATVESERGRGARFAPRANSVLVAVLALVAVAGVVSSTVLGWQLKQERDVRAASEAALAAARNYGVTLTSVDVNNLDRDFAAIMDGATGEFKDMYGRSSSSLRQLLVDNKATGKGTVLDAGVKSATETEVEVILFIDQTITNSASADPRVDRSRVSMTMKLVDGRWLASRVYLP
ncbi:hypothetical protein [Nocardia arizonensis]|uniref:hypothetical protein n=1 Tax=Nocardia arizonensis TaxID=1141647 RepID=UPI0006D13245|nr:hypothetical protein [Nocardia arizonensis]